MHDLKATLKELAGIESTYPHIMTCYFRVRDGGRERVKEARIFLKNRVSEIEAVLAGDSRGRAGLHREAAVAEHVLDQDVPPQATGIALFIKDGVVFKRFDTQFHFENQIAYRRVPHIAQLAFMDEEMEPLLIVSIDSRSATLFDVALGAMGGNRAEVQSEVHRRIHSGAYGQTRYQRHIDHQKREHLDDVVTQISAIVGRWGHKRIMITGPERTTAPLVALLPPGIAKRVIERKPMQSHASESEVLNEALAAFARAEREEEAAKMRRVRIEIHSSRMGVAGFDHVIKALNLGQCFQVLMAYDCQERGSECTKCGEVTVGSAALSGTCPSCDASKEHLKDLDLREYITRRCLQMGAELEYIKLPEFRATLGPVAALLHSPMTGHVPAAAGAA